MKIVVLFKVVYDDQDIVIGEGGALDFTRAKPVVSEYDLNALEAAAALAASLEGSKVIGITVGPAWIDDSKLKKNVLARGVDELIVAADDELAGLDAYATAAQLAALIADAGPFDLILTGDGSADDYAHQVDVQVACALGLPVVNAACGIASDGSSAEIERALEDVRETVSVALPVVVSVLPCIGIPRIPGMKDILAAGKKPQNIVAAPVPVVRTLETVSCSAPEQAKRVCMVADAADDDALAQFAEALKAAL